MKKFCVMALVFALSVTMFAACRRKNDPTGTSNSAPSSSTTTAATQATTKPDATTRPAGTGVLPSASDILPDMTDGTTGTGMGRSQQGPRY